MGRHTASVPTGRYGPWGWNEKGQSGNGVSERTATPTLADGNRVWKKTVGGKAYGFFLAEDGLCGLPELQQTECKEQMMV